VERIGQTDYCGKRPYMFSVLDGKVDLTNLGELCEAVGDKDPAVRPVAPFLVHHGEKIEVFLRVLVLEGSKPQCSEHVRGLAAQLVWSTTTFIEQAFMQGMTVVDLFGEQSKCPVPVDTEMHIDLVEPSTTWHPRNVCLTKRELSHYIVCSRKAFSTAGFISVCGPDATKVGDDLAVCMAYLAAPEANVVAVAAPQEYMSVRL